MIYITKCLLFTELVLFSSEDENIPKRISLSWRGKVVVPYNHPPRLTGLKSSTLVPPSLQSDWRGTDIPFSYLMKNRRLHRDGEPVTRSLETLCPNSCTSSLGGVTDGRTGREDVKLWGRGGEVEERRRPVVVGGQRRRPTPPNTRFLFVVRIIRSFLVVTFTFDQTSPVRYPQSRPVFV